VNLPRPVLAGLYVALSAGAFALARPSAVQARGLHTEELGFAVPGIRALLGFTRPLILPFLWLASRRAMISGRNEDVAAAARWITLVMPESLTAWDVFGWQLAYGAGTAPPTPDEELSRIVSALRWLEQGSRVQRDDTDLCLSIATILQDRLGNRNEHTASLGRLWRERLGEDPLVLARTWLDEAGRRGLGRGLGDRLALNAVALARAAFRRQDLRSVRHWTGVAVEGFAAESRRGNPDSEAWARELREQVVPALERLEAEPAPQGEERNQLLERLAASRLELR
jgi:hypothetical protein